MIKTKKRKVRECERFKMDNYFCRN